jgi:hypothetical protein
VTGVTLEIEFATAESEQRFCSSYLPAAWERYEASEYWEQGWFWAYSQFSGVGVDLDGGFVRLVFDGDPDALLSAEADRWESFEGLTDWSVRRYDTEGYDSLRDQQVTDKGAVGGDWEYRYKPLTARLALAYREEFDQRLPPSPKPSEDNPRGLGSFALVHALFVQMGYHWHEETDTYLRGIKNRIKSIGAHCGEQPAREEYERLRSEFESFDSELTEWLAETDTGTATL